MVVITGYGGYVPLYRIRRDDVASQHGGTARGESAVPARDENHVTMAAEAAGIALDRADVDGTDVDAVYAASVTDPFAQHGIAAHVAYRVGATGDVRTGDFRATGRSSTDALVAARTFVEATGGSALVVATDIVPVEPGDDEEVSAGAGAGAVVLAADAADPAATITGVGQETTGFVERHRRHGEPAEPGDAKFEGQYGFGEAVEAATDRALESADEDPHRAIVSAANQRMAGSALREFPDVKRESTFDAVGYAGAATFYLDLAHMLERSNSGETALAIGYGAGGADAIRLEIGGARSEAGLSVTEQIDSKEYVTYAKHLEYREPVDYQGVTAS